MRRRGSNLRAAAPLPRLEIGSHKYSPASSTAAGALAFQPPEGALVLANNHAMPSTLQLRFLRLENNELKQKIDGHYATPGSRTDNALGKRKADDELDL